MEGSEPCRQTQCRYHLEYRGNGEHRLKPTRDCALVVANEGERTLEEVAAVLGMSDERVRQVEERALQKLSHARALKRMYRESE
jgi:DNA-directed RNA polymerase specialized sigma24 family protein